MRGVQLLVCEDAGVVRELDSLSALAHQARVAQRRVPRLVDQQNVQPAVYLGTGVLQQTTALRHVFDLKLNVVAEQVLAGFVIGLGLVVVEHFAESIFERPLLLNCDLGVVLVRFDEAVEI